MTAGALSASAIAATTTAAANAPTRYRRRGAPRWPDARTFLPACLTRRLSHRRALDATEADTRWNAAKPVRPHGTADRLLGLAPGASATRSSAILTTFAAMDLAADAGLTGVTYSAEPGNRSEEGLRDRSLGDSLGQERGSRAHT